MPESLFSLSNLSLKLTLPPLIRGLLLAVIPASTWAGYCGGRESPPEVGPELLTQRLVSQSQHCAVHLTNQSLPGPNTQAIKVLLRFRSAAIRSGLTAILQQCAAPPDPDNLQVDVWEAGDSLNLAWPDGSAPHELRSEFDQFAAEPFKTAQAIPKEKDPGSTLLLECAPEQSSAAEQVGPSRLWQARIVCISLLATVEGLEVAA